MNGFEVQVNMNNIEKIKVQTAELLQYCYEYYTLDAPTISDAEYDKKFDELKRLEDEENFWLANSPTRKVQGQVLDCFTKVTHSKPMLSAAKTKDVNEIKKFVGDKKFYCSYKLDGATLVSIYNNGKFKQAITRGTGLIGEDVTEQAKMISNLPMTIPYDGYLELRGECVISWEQFDKINRTLAEPYSHPRNLAAGSLRQLNPAVTKERQLSYVVFECVSDLNDVDGLMGSKEIELRWLDMIGFETVKRCVGTVDDCATNMKPEQYKYPVDGLIFEYDNKSYSKSLPSTAHCEGCRMALKWADDVHETILRGVEWNTTRLGIIAPVAIFDEIDLDGALTTRATLHNVSIIESLELGIGDTITIYRSNMVIPKIDDNLTRSNSLVIPNSCPCCGHRAEIHNDKGSKTLHCTNPECPAKKIAQFTNFVSRRAANIEGLSEKTLETLISHGFLHNYRDIYHLNEHRDKLILLDGYGPKSIDNILQAIEKSRNITLENFITALGIPNIGATAAKTIAKHFKDIDTLLHSHFVEHFDWTTLNDFGQVMADSMSNYLQSRYHEITDLVTEFYFTIMNENEIRENPFSGKSVAVTGKLAHFSRDSINAKIAELGAKAASSVSSKTDFLITNEVSGSSKYKKAIELNVHIITEDEFLQMCGD